MQNLSQMVQKMLEQKLDRRGFIKQLGLTALISHHMTATLLAQENQSQHTIKSHQNLNQNAGQALGQAIAQQPTQAWQAPWKAPVGKGTTDLQLPSQYHAQILISWGDHLKLGKLKSYDQINAKWQKKAFGYNNDFIAYHALDHINVSHRGVLSVNHEYNNSAIMFPQSAVPETEQHHHHRPEQLKIEMYAVGHSVIEIQRYRDQAKSKGTWSPVYGSQYNRRLSALGPKMEIRGPVRGHQRVQTKADPEGHWITGTFSNCAGGTTPWGTTLIAEENTNQSFLGHLEELHVTEDFDLHDLPFYDQKQLVAQLQKSNLIKKIDQLTHSSKHSLQYINEFRNYVVSDINQFQTQYHWHLIEDRFDLIKEPNESNRFGWIVEYDPKHKKSVPVKRTALGRFKHECATTILSQHQKAIVYSGDDQSDEHLYRFISKHAFDPKNPEHNQHLLDEGELQVAQFHDNGSLDWIPLVHGQGKLVSEYGFWSQADVLIECRRAAKLVGATPLDRPEDIEVNPQNKHIFVMLTGSKTRKAKGPACPREQNPYGHILELMPIAGDDEGMKMNWQIYLLGQGPSKEELTQGGAQLQAFEQVLRNPDNAVFDPLGKLWVTSDFDPKGEYSYGNGLWLCDPRAEQQALRFCTLPFGAEPCGPSFTPDGKTLFLSIQHPAEGSSFENPLTRWPDFREDMPPRPSIVAIEHQDHLTIGS